MAPAPGDRGAQPRRHGERLRGGRLERAVRPAPRLRGLGLAQAQRPHPLRSLPLHRRGAGRRARAAARRDDRACAEGRPEGQRVALGYPRRAEGSGPGGAPGHRHRRGDRRRPRGLAERLRAPQLGDLRGLPRSRGGASLLRRGLQRARQPLLPRLGPNLALARDLHLLDEAARPRHRGLRAVQAGAGCQHWPGGGVTGEPGYSRTEVMTVAAARMLRNGAVCFVGIGLPSTAANLARLTHAPDAVLIYESGPIGARPSVLPLSIGDGDLSTSAGTVVSTPEIFRYWLQGGRIDVGFLGAAQIDRFANINTTIIGSYERPKVRLPGAGGAPEIAGMAGEVFIVVEQTPRTFVERLEFITSTGFLGGADARNR